MVSILSYFQFRETKWFDCHKDSFSAFPFFPLFRISAFPFFRFSVFPLVSHLGSRNLIFVCATLFQYVVSFLIDASTFVRHLYIVYIVYTAAVYPTIVYPAFVYPAVAYPAVAYRPSRIGCRVSAVAYRPSCICPSCIRALRVYGRCVYGRCVYGRCDYMLHPRIFSSILFLKDSKDGAVLISIGRRFHFWITR